MKLSVHLLLSLTGAIDAIFVKYALYGPDGNFGVLSLQDITAAAVEIEQLLKANGLPINVRVDQIIALIPLILSIIKSA